MTPRAALHVLQIGWRTTGAHLPTEDSNWARQLPNLAITESRRRLRRRWPGSRAGLSLGEARPAHAGPHGRMTRRSR